MTNKQFCARLRKAKKLAVQLYPDPGCIFYGCVVSGIFFEINATFDRCGAWDYKSRGWVENRAKSSTDIAALFDNSIRNLGEEP